MVRPPPAALTLTRHTAVTQSDAPPHAGFAWNLSLLERSPLHLAITLASGQSFRWRQDGRGIWWGVIGAAVAALWQPENTVNALWWQTFPAVDQYGVIADYLRLDFPIDDEAERWVHAEPRIREAVSRFRGLRILRQPPEECLFAFQCAACNTVVKIERSVQLLAARCGRRVSTGLAIEPFPFYVFPTAEAIAGADEAGLRADLWGYRAPRLIALGASIAALPPGWLDSLRTVPYLEARGALAGFFGIGTKLADCICLFALGKDEAVPVDTHVRQIAERMFLPEMAQRSLTPRVYEAIAGSFRDRFGATAGWAQQYLFFDSLRRSREYAGDSGAER